jgi:hypothetical protein
VPQRSFSDEATLRGFHVARLARFLRLVDEAKAGDPREQTELARRAAITAYCDCYDAGAGSEAQRLMDRFLETGPGWSKGWAKARRRGRPA